MINLIDEHGKLNQALKEFPNCTANIAIFGSQSSGKSTLVNAAFNTHFPVLDTKEDRKRCTRGVWLENNGKFNIIDTEGFDSVERQKDQRIFERQIALFCLAVADVIIVNVWMNEIGRYQGGQIHILKSIINAANHLVQSQSKTLLFVVKDCSRDANPAILKGEIEDEINRIIEECPSKGPKSLRFHIEYYFMSHYIYQREEYEKEAKKLPNIIKVRNASMGLHEPKDRVVYMNHLWETIIANDGEIDLRIEEEGLRNYVVNRIRNEVKEDIERLILAQTRIGKRNSYERMYQFFVKKSFEEIKLKLPRYVDQKTIKQQFFLLEEALQYIIQKHFSEVILPNQQKQLLTESLQKQLEKAYNAIQLQKIITEKRKKVLQLYKLLVQGHKEAPILIKRFAERITEESVNYQRQVSHLFNIFETKLENQVNKELDKQVRKLKFDGAKVTEKFKTLCKQFQYNQWQVNTKEIWEKASHRALTQKLTQKIDDFSGKQSYSMIATDKEAEIITEHKQLQKNVETFVQSLLQYFEQEDTGQQYIQQAKQKIREGLEKALIREKKRFRLSMLMLGIFLLFCYGQFMIVLKFVRLKKKTRSNLQMLYMIIAVILVAGSVIKKLIQNQNNARLSG